MSDASRRGFLASALTSGIGLKMAAAPSSSNLEMPVRTLGKTGLQVTVLGFGCMLTSDPVVIERAVDLGITYFDTARVYQSGNNERMVGAALKNARKSITLSSKTPAKTKEAALADLDTSLRALGTDHLDIWYLHAKTKQIGRAHV